MTVNQNYSQSPYILKQHDGMRVVKDDISGGTPQLLVAVFDTSLGIQYKEFIPATYKVGYDTLNNLISVINNGTIFHTDKFVQEALNESIDPRSTIGAFYGKGSKH